MSLGAGGYGLRDALEEHEPLHVVVEGLAHGKLAVLAAGFSMELQKCRASILDNPCLYLSRGDHCVEQGGEFLATEVSPGHGAPCEGADGREG